MKAKRLVALLMALVLVVGLFAISASAGTGNCPRCGFVETFVSYSGTWRPGSPSRTVDSCRFSSSRHSHANATRINPVVCNKCREDIGSSFESTSNYCPIGGAVA